MKPEQMRELLTFNQWADRRMMEAVSALTPEQFSRDLHSSFPSVRDTLAHIATVEWVWLERARQIAGTNARHSGDPGHGNLASVLGRRE